MELAAGRGSKESSSGRGGGGGSESGRYSSSRSDREKGPSGGGRDYSTEGRGGGRSGGGGERDRDRDRRGGEKQRRMDESRGGGGSSSSRHYSDGRQDKGYRYTGHRDRSSRSPAPDDRHKRHRVSDSPGADSRTSGSGFGHSSSSSRRDGKDKDRHRLRDSDRGGGRERGSGGSGRRLADLPEEAPAEGVAVDAGNGVRNSGGGGGCGRENVSANSMEGVANGSGGGDGDVKSSNIPSPSGGSGGSGGGRYKSGGSSAAAGAGTGGGGGEEGEVLLSSSPRVWRKDVANGNSGGGGDDDGGNSHSSGSVDRCAAGSGGGSSAARSSSPPRESAISSPGDGGGGGGEVGPGGDAPNRPSGKDRWADSDSDEEDDGGGKSKGGNAGGGGDAVAPNKVNGSANGGTAGDGGSVHEGRNGLGVGGGAGNRGAGGAGEGGGEGSGRLDASGAAELKLAMAAASVGADGLATAGEDGGEAAGGGGNGAMASSAGGEGGGADENGGGAGGGGRPGVGGGRMNPTIPMTVFTRHLAAQDTYNPLLYGCRSVENYERIQFIDEGAYGKVYCALNKTTGEVVALKQVKLTTNNKKEGFPITALRETNVLLSLHNPNIVRVLEMVIGSTLDKVYMVMEYFDHDLKSVMRHMRHQKRCFSLGQVKSLVLQLLSATEYMHRHWYIHRDLKTSNLLYNHQGKLAVCDFGLARKYEEPIRPYTTPVVTQWYRCPELLLGEKTYSTGVDTWSVGTIFGELLLGSPMFQGKTEIDQLKLIFGVLGSPTEDRWPGWSKLPGAKSVNWRQGTANQLRATFPTSGFSGKPSVSTQGLELMNGLLALDPRQRTSAHDAMQHCWFTTEKPAPTPLGDMPQVDSKLDKDINNALAKWAKAQVGKQSTRGGISPTPPPRSQRPEAGPK